MIYKGNQGYTRQQIRASYRHKNPRERAPAFTCNLTRARHKSHTRTFGQTNPVQFYLNQPKIVPMSLYKTVRRKLKTEIKSRLNFDSDHIDITTLTVYQIRTIFEIVDEFYFDGTLLADMATHLTGQTIQISIGNSNDPSIMMETVMTEGDVVAVEWKLFSYIWGHIQFPYIHDGLRTENTLELLIIIIQHEFIHGIIFIYQRDMSWENGNDHGRTFLTLNNRIFGHSDSTYDNRVRMDEIVIQ